MISNMCKTWDRIRMRIRIRIGIKMESRILGIKTMPIQIPQHSFFGEYGGRLAIKIWKLTEVVFLFFFVNCYFSFKQHLK